MALPALRALDFQPLEHEGESYISVSDPSGVVDEQLLLSPLAFFVAAQLTGFNDVEEIQKAFEQQFGGAVVPPERIYEVVKHLDERGLLLTDTFDALQRKVHDGFTKSSTRLAYHAGKSYPLDRDEARAFLDSQFLREGAPGCGLGPPPGDDTPPIRGLIVPHIDLHRGGHAYAHGYLRMYQAGRPKTVLVFGVAHNGQAAPFILTRKHFETPFGTIETDLECIAKLEQACDWDPYEFEIVHRTEHSLEFQALMLAYLYGPDVRIVPILCSMFSDDPGLTDPASIEPVSRFLDACKEWVQAHDGEVSVIGAADLAHVGKRFGDTFEIDDGIVKKVAARDKEDLAFVQTFEPERFYRSVMNDANQRRVCGLNCIYSVLKSLDGTAKDADQVCYDYAHDPMGGIVSFTSLVLT